MRGALRFVGKVEGLPKVPLYTILYYVVLFFGVLCFISQLWGMESFSCSLLTHRCSFRNLPKQGWWAGVQLDEPRGKNDGAVEGCERCFECPAGYGLFVRPYRVSCGDFPEEDLWGSDDEL
jgi:hypothetical protein